MDEIIRDSLLSDASKYISFTEMHIRLTDAFQCSPYEIHTLSKIYFHCVYEKLTLFSYRPIYSCSFSASITCYIEEDLLQKNHNLLHYLEPTYIVIKSSAALLMCRML